MFRLSWHKAIHFLVLFSLLLQSCVPVGLNLAGSAIAVPAKVNHPNAELVSYQPAVFEHPEARIGERPVLSSSLLRQYDATVRCVSGPCSDTTAGSMVSEYYAAQQKIPLLPPYWLPTNVL